MKDNIEDLIDTLDLLENYLFDNKYKVDIGGRTYSKSGWREYKTTLEKVLKTIHKQQKASAKYLIKNKEYNRKMRLISYYRHKKNKTEQDYVQIEQLRRELETFLKEKEEKKEKQQEKELKEVQEALINLSNYNE